MQWLATAIQVLHKNPVQIKFALLEYLQEIAYGTVNNHQLQHKFLEIKQYFSSAPKNQAQANNNENQHQHQFKLICLLETCFEMDFESAQKTAFFGLFVCLFQKQRRLK